MKYTGIILGGGKGLELYPLTPMINKALLPIGNKKMIMYQLELLDKPCITSNLEPTQKSLCYLMKALAALKRT